MKNGRAYSPADDAVILRYSGMPCGIATAARMLGRSKQSVISRAFKLNAARLPSTNNLEETKAITQRDGRMYGIYQCICKHPGVTVRDIADATGYPFAEVQADVGHLLQPTYAGRTTNIDSHGAPLVISDGGRLRQNHHVLERPAANPDPGILTFRTGFEGGRVNKRRMR